MKPRYAPIECITARNRLPGLKLIRSVAILTKTRAQGNRFLFSIWVRCGYLWCISWCMHIVAAFTPLYVQDDHTLTVQYSFVQSERDVIIPWRHTQIDTLYVQDCHTHMIHYSSVYSDCNTIMPWQHDQTDTYIMYHKTWNHVISYWMHKRA